MTHSRRSILQKASTFTALAVGGSGVASAADCRGVAAWDSAATYTNSDQATYDGSLYEANWWTRGDEPGTGGEWGPWDLVDSCGEGSGGENASPTASFTADMSMPAPNESVSFDASESSDSDGSISSYRWDFGDGSSGSGQTASHSYSSAGDYTVRLTVTDTDGATGTDSATISVSSAPSNVAPDASFTASPSSPATDEVETFDAADASDSDGTIVSYSWQFGDGSTASGQSVNHSYSSTGDYTVTLTVTDDDGATDANSTTVTVESSDGGGTDCSAVPAWDASTVYHGGDRVVRQGTRWQANWWVQGKIPGEGGQWGPWDREGDCQGATGLKPVISASNFVNPDEEVSFDAGSSSGNITSYEWAFGDGATVTGQTATHRYSSMGEYAVTLTVGDGTGNTNSTSVTMTVSNSTGFPENMFAPYVDVLLQDQDPLVESVDKAGTRHFLLAFVVADTDGDPAWGGNVKVGPTSPNLDIGSQITELRNRRGGDVIVSFGGLQGTYLPETTTSAEELKNKYATVVDAYDLKFIDFDEEKLVGSRSGREKISLRNEALVLLKEEYPDLKISYTLPVLPMGFPSQSTNNVLFALEDAAEKGLEIDLVNPMTMDYGSQFEMTGDTVIQAGKSVHDQLGDVWPNKSATERWQMIGLTPMIGQNDVNPNVFDQAEARTVRDWASQQNIKLLSFWELVRDNGEGEQLYNNTRIDSEPYEFSEIFNTFNSR